MSISQFFSYPGPKKQTTRKPASQTVSVSWPFVASLAALILFALVVTCGFFWFFSYGFQNTPPKSITVQHISHPADITWHTNGLAAINSDDLPASLAALGYVHGTQDPWQMMLWRQTALGDLSAWFGPSLLRLDRFNKQLSFSRLAEATFSSLPREKQKLLEAYAAGVNAGIQEQNLLTHDEFAFLGSPIDPWKPWHTLAVERLFAWMTTSLPEHENIPTGDFAPYLTSLVEADKSLHEFLQIYGFQYSFAGSWQASNAYTTDFFYHRLVYGASAHSIFQEINIKLPAQPPVFVSTIPGTLIFLSGQGQQVSWALLPASDLSLNRRPPGAIPTVSHERIINRDGTEFLATFTHYPGFLSSPPDTSASSDSTYALFWEGFLEGTDSFTFIEMLQGNKPTLKMFSGNGLWSDNQQRLDNQNTLKTRAYMVLGKPDYTYNFAHGMLISATPWTAYTASLLDSLSTNLPALLNPKTWVNECYNPWAAENAPGLFASLASPATFASPMYREAITYLRNWDYSYSSSSIGAAIFENWLTHLGLSTTSSRLTIPIDIDTTKLQIAFKQTVDGLNASYGADLSQWRLEKTRPVLRYFPAWVADSLYSPDETPLSKTNYAPLVFPGKGDVATLCEGSFTSGEYGAVSAQWETWSTQRNGKTAEYWRKQVTPFVFSGKIPDLHSPQS